MLQINLYISCEKWKWRHDDKKKYGAKKTKKKNKKKTYRKHFGWSARSIKKWSLMHCPLRIFADIPLSSSYWFDVSFCFFSVSLLSSFLYRLLLSSRIYFISRLSFDCRCCLLIKIFSSNPNQRQTQKVYVLCEAVLLRVESLFDYSNEKKTTDNFFPVFLVFILHL